MLRDYHGGMDESPGDRAGARRRIFGIAAALLAVVALTIAWRWGPLGEWLSLARLRQLASAIEASPWSGLWVLGAYVAGSLLAMPITLLIVATAFVLGAWAAIGYALAGSLLSAALTFWLGRILGRRAVRELAGRRLNELSRRLGDGGVLAVTALRLLPVAPFAVVNLVAGASHLRLRDFLIGTALGMAPGILGIALFYDRLAATLRDPSTEQVGLLALVLIGLVLAALAFHRVLRARTP